MNSELSEDTLTYLKRHNIPAFMEFILREIIAAKPEKPIKFVKELLSTPIAPRIVLVTPPESNKPQLMQTIQRYMQKSHGKKPMLISSGDLLRSEVYNRTETGKMAESFMAAGELVPDNVVIALIRKELEKDEAREEGWVLDGFPRTKQQAIFLEKSGNVPETVVQLHIPDEVLFERVEGRRTDPVSGEKYHLVFNPPPPEDAVLNDRLEQKPEDTRAEFGPKLTRYHELKRDWETYFDSITEMVDGDREENAYTKDVLFVIERRHIK